MVFQCSRPPGCSRVLAPFTQQAVKCRCASSPASSPAFHPVQSGRLSSAAGGNLLALLASRLLVGHWDRQGYPEKVMLIVAHATVVIAGSHRHVQCLSLRNQMSAQTPLGKFDLKPRVRGGLQAPPTKSLESYFSYTFRTLFVDLSIFF